VTGRAVLVSVTVMVVVFGLVLPLVHHRPFRWCVMRGSLIWRYGITDVFAEPQATVSGAGQAPYRLCVGCGT
jgi:hypothetical protein